MVWEGGGGRAGSLPQARTGRGGERTHRVAARSGRAPRRSGLCAREFLPSPLSLSLGTAGGPTNVGPPTPRPRASLLKRAPGPPGARRPGAETGVVEWGGPRQGAACGEVPAFSETETHALLPGSSPLSCAPAALSPTLPAPSHTPPTPPLTFPGGSSGRPLCVCVRVRVCAGLCGVGKVGERGGQSRASARRKPWPGAALQLPVRPLRRHCCFASPPRLAAQQVTSCGFEVVNKG